jgi:hypothetical protein
MQKCRRPLIAFALNCSDGDGNVLRKGIPMLCEQCQCREANVTRRTEQQNPDGISSPPATQQLCEQCFNAMLDADPQLAEQVRATKPTVTTTTVSQVRTFEPVVRPPPPYVIFAAVRCFLGKIGFGPAPWKVNWSDSLTDVCARFLVGLVIAAGVCFLLVPTFFWPSKNEHRIPAAQRGIYQKKPDAVPPIFIVIAGTIVIGWAATTRVTLRGSTPDLLAEWE